MDDYVIDPEIKSYLPVLTKEELDKLEANILDGLHVDPAVVCVVNGQRILGDGHNRRGVCLKHNLTLPIREKEFESREAMIQWVIDNQLGRRNLTEELKSYYRGKEYLNNRRNSEQVAEHKVASVATGKNPGKMREKLAEKHGVSPRTIQNDADFAQAVDKIEAEQGVAAKVAVLNGHSGQSRAETVKTKAVVLCDLCKATEPKKDCEKCYRLRHPEEFADEPDAILDDENNIVPAALRQYFVFSDKYLSAAATLAKLAKLMRQIEECEAYRTVDALCEAKGERRDYSSMMSRARDKLLAWRPAVRCECSDGCDACGKKRFLTVEEVEERDANAGNI